MRVCCRRTGPAETSNRWWDPRQLRALGAEGRDATGVTPAGVWR
jgi:hypothetical protein